MAIVASATVSGDIGYAVDVFAGHHALKADEPVEGGGTDVGPSPYALVLSGLGACTAITLRMYAERKGWDLGHVDVHLELDKHEGSETITRRLRFSGLLDDEQRNRLLEISEKTPVTLSLKRGMEITTHLS
jgi:putative redox protein